MEEYDTESLSDNEIDSLIKVEMNYRLQNGETIPTDENLCKFCRNIDKKNPFCWNCNSGSLYLPITFPLYNIVLMLCSLMSGLKESEHNNDSNEIIIIQQKGIIEALKFVLQPFGTIDEIFKYFYDDVMSSNKNFCVLDEIEKAKQPFTLVESIETMRELKYRTEIETTRTHLNACIHCKNRDKLKLENCWNCDRGNKFYSGIRSLNTISKMLMFINTVMGENSINTSHDDNNTIINIGIAEGLKWVVKPYITEKELMEMNGMENITKETIEDIIRSEDEEFKYIDNL